MTTACAGAPRTFTADEAESVAWFVEDVARGNERRPEELSPIQPSDGMRQVAVWAAGSRVRGRYIPPRPLEARRNRWPALHSLFTQALALSLDNGLVAGRPDLSRDDRAYVLSIIDDENHDRRAIDAVVLSASQADETVAQRYMVLTTSARVKLDRDAGATVQSPVKAKK